MRKTLALCLLLVAAVTANAFAAAEARMTGKIRDALTTDPIPGATITLVSTGGRNFKAEYKADKDGSYRFLVLDGTLTYQVTFAAPGYQPYVETMKLKIGEYCVQQSAPASGRYEPLKSRTKA